ncbi:hypothetical protein EZJ19_03540 [Parasulfuritortus cantonensis]|uniref:Uncharacterized protein n=1 Tax=Parasulfuritortus cantonensis TaxID=2528202 RepID=A0A4R1BKS2_9PROT|nr:hypothetical protein [Parasulfuritortus cantonensis]TCJ17990.1 hypothetical protein EZJ19_03540 [Parasulfuritortus cantonensis]
MAIQVLTQEEICEVAGGLSVSVDASPALTLDLVLSPTGLLSLVGSLLTGVLSLVTGLLCNLKLGC